MLICVIYGEFRGHLVGLNRGGKRRGIARRLEIAEGGLAGGYVMRRGCVLNTDSSPTEQMKSTKLTRVIIKSPLRA